MRTPKISNTWERSVHFVDSAKGSGQADHLDRPPRPTTSTMVYNNRLQMTSMTATKAGSTVLALGLFYCPSQGTLCGTNNGNLISQTIRYPQISTSGQPDYEASLNLTQNYGSPSLDGYDALNRLVKFSESGASRDFSYDRYGNGWVSSNSGFTLNGLTPKGQSWFNPTNNHLTGLDYDARGNQKQVNPFTLTYDGENRQKSADGGVVGSVAYEYDADGRRVRKLTCAGAGPCTPATPGVAITVFVYDASGQLAAEYSTAPTSGGTEYLTADHLGSIRLVTDSSGTVKRRYDYLPFGEGIDAALNGRSAKYSIGAFPGVGDGQSIKFTAKERDAETNLDYFGARYFSGAMGRFTSPDPVWITPKRMLDPQELNLYAYVRNNPLKYIDPDGTILELAASSEEDAKKKFALIQRGLTQADRSHVQLVVGDGKNGFAKGHFGITADADYKSNSGNFQTIQGTANSKDLAIAAIVRPGEKFASNMGVQQGAQVVIASFASKFGQDNYVSSKDAVPGQTLFQLFGSPLADTLYSPDKASRVYVANDQTDSELVKTFFHELRHVYLGDFGRSIPQGSHPAADKDIQGIERESDRNFNGTPVRKK